MVRAPGVYTELRKSSVLLNITYAVFRENMKSDRGISIESDAQIIQLRNIISSKDCKIDI